MCGFAGFFDPAGLAQAECARSRLEAMNATLVHRGPDAGGVWMDPGQGIALAHRRLAILDLSAYGSQPMHSTSGRYTIVYNGEVYNHLSLRDELGGREWRGHSDTETLLAAFEEWGVERTLRAAIGMFAFALWDSQTATLTLARDRIGEKPLYFGWQDQGGRPVLLFGSELKALRRHPAFAGRIDPGALRGYTRYGYVRGARSIYEGIEKLAPGTFITISMNGRSAKRQVYWALPDPSQCSRVGDFSEAVDRLERILSDAIGRQLISDVPLGAFLSGGIDSSTIVALMQTHSSRPVRTFTIGFEAAGFDEAKMARAIAQHLGTDHTELYLTAADALATIPLMPQIYDEPFADSSQIPTYLVARLAREHVTVALSGDGGDELFGGYERYALAQTTWARTARMPRAARQFVAATLGAVPIAGWALVGKLAGQRFRGGRKSLADMARRAEQILRCNSPREINDLLSTKWSAEGELLRSGAASEAGALAADDTTEAMMAADCSSYLPDDIMVKVDRAAMAVSLETRSPFLDHTVVEHVCAMPPLLKYGSGQTKIALRSVLARHVPPEMFERPKQGFSVPIHEWLRGPLRDWAGDLLASSRIGDAGFFDPETVSRAWRAHQSGAVNRQAELWTVLMFQAWFDAQGAGAG